MLQKMEVEQDPGPHLAKCGRMVADLVSGRYDALSGKYLDAKNELAETLRQTQTA